MLGLDSGVVPIPTWTEPIWTTAAAHQGCPWVLLF